MAITPTDHAANMAIVVSLLHEIDGHLGLAIHRKEHRTNETEWLAEAEEYRSRLRMVIPAVKAAGEAVGVEPTPARIDVTLWPRTGDVRVHEHQQTDGSDEPTEWRDGG